MKSPGAILVAFALLAEVDQARILSIRRDMGGRRGRRIDAAARLDRCEFIPMSACGVNRAPPGRTLSLEPQRPPRKLSGKTPRCFTVVGEGAAAK